MTAKPFVFSIRPVYLDMFRAGTKRRLRDGTPHDLARHAAAPTRVHDAAAVVVAMEGPVAVAGNAWG